MKHLSFNREKTAFVCAGMTGFKTFETATARVIDAGPTFSEGGSCLAEMVCYSRSYISTLIASL